MKKTIIVILAFALSSGCIKKNEKSATIHFGVLPVLQALPLFVASHNHYFQDEKINVDLILFNSAADKDIAFSSSQLNGMFADLVTPVILAGNHISLNITATNYRSDLDRRMFAILAKKGSALTTVEQIDKTPIAVSSNSVIDLTTDLLTHDVMPEGKH